MRKEFTLSGLACIVQGLKNSNETEGIVITKYNQVL